MIEFAGIRSDERFLIVEHYPVRTIPKRKYQVQEVPGRSGAIAQPEAEDAFSNYDQSYTVFLDAQAPGLPMVSRGLAEWLLGNPGYQRLEDSYDPDFYRMAYYVGGDDFSNIFNEYGRGTLKFNCAPKRFYKSGEREITVTSGDTLYSPSIFKAKPILKFVWNSGIPQSVPIQAVITVTDKNNNSKAFRINPGSANGEIVVDSEAHTAYGYVEGQDPVNLNSSVASDYENLYLDSVSSITFNNRVLNLKVIPRWWTI